MYEILLQNNKTPAIVGAYSAINKGSKSNADVIIKVFVGASADIAEVSNAANGMLNTKGLIGVFCSNEGAVNGFLAAMNAGTKVPSGVKVVGYDAGAGQKGAIKKGIIMGSVSQNPYEEGYQAVKLAKEACDGKKGENKDTGAIWYDSKNIDDPKLKDLLYD